MLGLIPEIDNGHPSFILISNKPGVLTLVLGLVAELSETLIRSAGA